MAATVAASVAEITASLAKKNSFMQAVGKLKEEVMTSYSGSQEAEKLLLFNASKRSFTLLCSRCCFVRVPTQNIL